MKNKAKNAFLLTLIVFGLLIVVCYMYIYQSYTQKTADLQSSNQKLQARVEELRGFYEKMSLYEDRIDYMTTDINDRLGQYPSDIKEEDAIYLALRTWEEEIPVAYKAIKIGGKDTLGIIAKDKVSKAGIEGLDKEVVFKERTANYSTITTYTGLKDLLASLNDNQEQLAITNLAYSIDENGLLEGTVNCTFYTVEGTDKPYVPKEFKEYPLGITELFKND